MAILGDVDHVSPGDIKRAFEKAKEDGHPFILIFQRVWSSFNTVSTVRGGKMTARLLDIFGVRGRDVADVLDMSVESSNSFQFIESVRPGETIGEVVARLQAQGENTTLIRVLDTSKEIGAAYLESLDLGIGGDYKKLPEQGDPHPGEGSGY